MKIEKTIEAVMTEILKEELDQPTLFKKLEAFKLFLLEVTGLDLNNLDDRKDIQFENGIALSTTFAALCINDIMRTRQFMRGIYQAIKDKLYQNTKPVHLFYAGTGPFATLILPILTRFSPKEIQLTLLDVNQKTLEYLNLVIEELSIGDYIDQIICADASIYQFDQNQKIDVLVSETMQYGLVKEQQVPIMINLVTQLSKEAIVIPNNIQLDLAHRNLSSNLLLEGKNHLMYKRLKKLLDFTPEFIHALNGNGKEQKRFELCENIDFSEDKGSYNTLVILTAIQVYKEEWIHVDLSSLTIPKTLFLFDRERDKTEISISYVIKQQPDFEFELN